MKTNITIVSLKLENEMDLILAHKRSMKVAELCGISLSMQTYFATAVSEIARLAMGKKKTRTTDLSLNVVAQSPSKKLLQARVSISKEELQQGGEEAIVYARRLVEDVVLVNSARGNGYIELHQQVPHGGLVTDAKLAEFSAFFRKEPPLSPYDEIRKKNIQLIALSDKLKVSENDYKKLTQNLPLMMFTLNSVGRISRTNEWLNTFYSEKSGKLEGLSWQSLIHPPDHALIAPLWEKAQIDRQPLNIQARLKQTGKDEPLWHLIRILPIKDKSNNVTEWAGFFVDIHAQKLVEQTLKNNEELKRAQKQLLMKNNELTLQKEFVETILDSSVDLIAVYDTQMKLLAFNKRAESVYRLNRADVLGKTLTDVFPDGEVSNVKGDLERALNGEFIHNPTFESVHAGRIFESFLLPLFNHKQKVYGVLVIAHDITDKFTAEQELKAANRQLQKSNHDLEQFAYVASHDLQEPLRKIRNYSQLLGKNIGNPEQASKFLGKVDESAQRMSALIKDVLNYSKLTAETDARVNVDLNDVLHLVMSDFELILEEKKATIEGGDLPVVKAVPLQMQQLFSNLIGNSLKFSEAAPVISVTSAKVTNEERKSLQLPKGRDYYSIYFSDNGIGFEQQYAEQIFTIFQRLINRDEYSGTGIGLALCKKIVDKHEGLIMASSEPGKGSEFRVILPAN